MTPSQNSGGCSLLENVSMFYIAPNIHVKLREAERFNSALSPVRSPILQWNRNKSADWKFRN